MPLGTPAANSHELLAVQQTLEDEFCDWLSPAQIQQVLHAAGGELGAARAACAAAAAAATQQQQQQQQAGRGGEAASEDGPSGSPSQRHWWPQSPFCRPPSGPSGVSAAAAAPVVQPPRLVPRHLLQPSRQPPPPPLQQQQAGMQSGAAPPQRASAASSRGTVAAGSTSRQSPAAVTLRRLLGPAAGGSCSGTATAPRQPGILTRSTGASSSGASSLGGGSSSAGARPSAQAGSPAVPAPARQREVLHPHYAAVFLTDRSREQLLQHVAPLHETISADHMTLAYKPSLQQCRGLPLGREAALFVVGVAADYRAQAVAVEHPSWVPFLSESSPHVTISVGEEVPAKEAGDLTAAAVASPGLLTPVARLKLLQGVVGVQLSDGRRLFSAADLEAALAEAAALEQQQQAPGAPAAAGAPRILKRGQAPPLPLVPGGSPAAAAPAQQDALAGPPSVPQPAAVAAAAGASSSSSGGKAPAWDLDALLDQLHLAEPVPPTTAGAAGSRQQQPAAPQPEQPRRGLLKLPAGVASEMAAPRSAAGTAGTAAGTAVPARPPIAVMRRPAPHKVPGQHQQQPRQQFGYGAAGRAGGEWVEPAASVQPSFAKTATEEAAEAAQAGEPLDMVSSLAFLLPLEQQPARQQQAAAADAVSPAIPPEPPLPSPKMLQGAGTSSGEAGEAGGAASGAAAGGYETSGSEASSSIGPAASGAAVDAEAKQLLQLQYPELHELVVETALRMHGGSLPEATQFLIVLDHQQRELGPAAARAGAAPAQPTLGAYLQGLLPEPSAGRAAAGAGYDPPASSSGASSFADSSYDFGLAAQRPGAGRGGRASGGVTGGWQVQPGSGGGRGRGKGRRGSGAALAGDDPMSVTERQAMNTHLTAKRIYTQAAQEAYNRGQVALSKELQATARVHGDAASEARRRANASAFRSTNATVQNTFTLDLHGQHVEEALASLERYLVTLGGLGHPGGVMLQVITGVGRHSAGNQPRVLPAVVRYLSDAGYKFEGEEGNPGIINVAIGC